jgi:hypothetical protein
MSSGFSNGQLTDLLELLLQDLRAFGLFSSQLSHRRRPDSAHFDAYVSQRLPSISRVMRGIDSVLDIAIKNESMPILYNTGDWPQNAPIAGYATLESGIKYSNLLTTYIGNWKYEHDTGVFHSRLLRAALYMWQTHGLKGAIDYLFDLEKYGYFILPQAVEGTITLLIHAHARGNCAERIVALCFGGELPQTAEEWLKWDWDIGVRRTTIELITQLGNKLDRAIVKAILEHIILNTLNINEQTRQVDNPIDWMLDQAYVFLRCRQVISLCEHFKLERSVALKSILDQFEEIQADSGSIFLADYSEYKRRFSPLPNPVVMHARAFLLIFQANFGPEEGESRLYSERVIYPAVLREQILTLFKPPEERQLGEWRIVPPRLYFPFLISRGNIDFDAISNSDIEKIQEGLQTAWETDQSEEIICRLKDLYDSYPYLSSIHQELAIFYDEQSDLQKAWEHILTALVLDTNSYLIWQSFSVILMRLGNKRDARLAQAISKYLEQEELK